MQWLFILAAVAWVAISVVGNRKKQQARAEAEKRAAAEQTAPASPAQPAQPFSPYFPDAKPQPPVKRPQPQHAAPQPVMKPVPVSGMQEGPRSTLTEIKQTQRHTLAPSGKDGHAHEETSMTGFTPDCPPESAATASAPAAAAAGMPAFSWQPNAVLNGIVYAEILGKPKALRG